MMTKSLMARNSKSKPSFFKIMLVDFTRHLSLPPMFVQKYGEILPENTKLRISSGETWNVELKRVNDETYRFNRGWTKFAADMGLEIGDFLVFWFIDGNSTFDVSVYGASGCERQVPVVDSPVDDLGSDEDDVELIKVKNNDSEEWDNSSDEEANPQFKLLLKKHHESRVSVRKEFAVAAGLTRKKTVVLKYPPKQRRWHVSLDHFTKLSHFRLEMTLGWSKFRRENGLVIGKTYLFEYIRDKNVIECKLDLAMVLKPPIPVPNY